MKSTVLVIFSLSAVLSNPIQNIRQAKEIGLRRQFVSYSNNVVHENPNYPDQAAQSSVKVNFNSNQGEVRKPVYTSNAYQQEKPVYSGNKYQQEFSQVQPFTQNYVTNAPQSQLFNVGYSVSFTNDNKPTKPQVPKYPRKTNLDDGEIITGTRKRNEEVQVPVNVSPQEYVQTALISTKKQKISGIKPKPQYITTYQNPKALLSQANLSPSTQKYYKVLEQLKPQVQNTQELQQKYTWRNLSPGVEIIRSTEVPTTKYGKSEQSYHFDHARALGRSQDFDQSNALDNSNSQSIQQNALFYNSVRKSQPKQPENYQQIPVLINQNGALAMDTSLLREPITIQVDTRYVDQAALYNPQFAQSQEQPVQEVNYLQQAYRTIPVEQTQNKPVQVVYRQEPQVFQNYEPDQNRFHLKVYGKSQPLTVGQEVKRQPRFVSDLNTNLRPPPFDVPYQRRIRVY